MIKTTMLPGGGVIISADTKADGEKLLAKVYGIELVKVESPKCDCRDYGEGIVCKDCEPGLFDSLKEQSIATAQTPESVQKMAELIGYQEEPPPAA
jgi:hypothetical protein